MTPEDKAKELVQKYHRTCNATIAGTSTIFWSIAKQCAIIAVDEIFKYMGEIDDETTMPEKQPNGLPYTCWHYWVTVKDAIQKL